MTGPALSPPVYAILTGLVEERIGLHYGPEDRELFADRLASRLEESGLATPLDYYYRLRYDDPGGTEMALLAEALVVSETYFFREADAVRIALDVVIAPALAERGRARVWSAACSTGEEPLTLASLLADRGQLEACEIVATDLSARSLARARTGQHGVRAMRAMPAGGSRWLRADGPLGRPTSDLRLREHIEWRLLNLLDAQAVAALGRFDLILCRNVLIYFRDPTIVRVIEGLSRALAAGGLLAVGASESLLRFGTLLTCEEHGGAFFYRRTAS